MPEAPVLVSFLVAFEASHDGPALEDRPEDPVELHLPGRLADMPAADAKPLGEGPLGRKPIPRFQDSARRQLPDLPDWTFLTSEGPRQSIANWIVVL